MFDSDRGYRTHAEATAHEFEQEMKYAFGGNTDELKPAKNVFTSGVKSENGKKAQESLKASAKTEIPLSALAAKLGKDI